MAEPSLSQKYPRALELMQRLIRLRSRFRLVVPENIVTLKKQISEAALSPRGVDGNDADLFFQVGTILSSAEKPVSMGELSRELNVPLSTATRIMDWLVHNGYAQRLADPQDRRVVRVGLTDPGREIYRTINQFAMERVEFYMNQLSVEERATFEALLFKLLDAVEREL